MRSEEHKVEAAVKTVALAKRYGKNDALRPLDLEIYSGELFGLLGTNGAGKSTAVSLLSCLIAPTSGDAFIMGNSVIKNSSEAKRVVNISPQETAVAPALSVRENLELMCGLWGMPEKLCKKKACEYIEKFGMESFGSKKAKALSGGMKRRLSIAMSLITDPQMVFLDEPTLGVDVLARRELWKMIERMKGEKTVILTTHYLEEAEALCDRIAILHEGRLAALGTPEEITEAAGCECFEDAFVYFSTERTSG